MAEVTRMKSDGAMILLPPAPDCCQVCATKHEPELPHNPRSFYWQFKFNIQHGRVPTWKDALAHCSDEMKDLWVKALAEEDIHVNLGE